MMGQPPSLPRWRVEDPRFDGTASVDRVSEIFGRSGTAPARRSAWPGASRTTSGVPASSTTSMPASTLMPSCGGRGIAPNRCFGATTSSTTTTSVAPARKRVTTGDARKTSSRRSWATRPRTAPGRRKFKAGGYAVVGLSGAQPCARLDAAWRPAHRSHAASRRRAARRSRPPTARTRVDPHDGRRLRTEQRSGGDGRVARRPRATADRPLPTVERRSLQRRRGRP